MHNIAQVKANYEKVREVFEDWDDQLDRWNCSEFFCVAEFPGPGSITLHANQNIYNQWKVTLTWSSLQARSWEVARDFSERLMSATMLALDVHEVLQLVSSLEEDDKVSVLG